jgi:hypothetical protein
MLLECIRNYLISVLRYTFLILDTHDPDNLYLRQQTCGDPWLFFKDNRGSEEKSLGNIGLHKGQRDSPETVKEKI